MPIVRGEKANETPILVAMGIDLGGQRSVLSFMPAGAESVEAWQGLIDDLKWRGVAQVDLFVTDGDDGLIGALERSFPATARQRCWVHKVHPERSRRMRNVLAKIPKRAKKDVAAALKGIVAQDSREAALQPVAVCPSQLLHKN